MPPYTPGQSSHVPPIANHVAGEWILAAGWPGPGWSWDLGGEDEEVDVWTMMKGSKMNKNDVFDDKVIWTWFEHPLPAGGVDGEERRCLSLQWHLGLCHLGLLWGSAGGVDSRRSWRSFFGFGPSKDYKERVSSLFEKTGFVMLNVEFCFFGLMAQCSTWLSQRS